MRSNYNHAMKNSPPNSRLGTRGKLKNSSTKQYIDEADLRPKSQAAGCTASNIRFGRE